jgi:hypothetical protein
MMGWYHTPMALRLDGVEQVALDVAARGQALVERLVEHLEAVAPGALGFVERLVGKADHVGHLGSRPPPRCRCSRPGGRRSARWRKRSSGSAPARWSGGRLPVGLQGVEHRELVAAPAPEHRVMLASRACSQPATSCSTWSPVLWPKASFTALKPSRSSSSSPCSRPSGPAMCKRGGLGEAFAVEQAGERIVRGPKVQLLRGVERQRMHLAQLRGQEQRLVLQAAALAEGLVALQRAACQRPRYSSTIAPARGCRSRRHTPGSRPPTAARA